MATVPEVVVRASRALSGQPLGNAKLCATQAVRELQVCQQRQLAKDGRALCLLRGARVPDKSATLADVGH